MLKPFIQHRRPDARQGERGVTMALVAMSMFAVIAMAGLSIDLGTLYQASDEAQRAADAGALAAARTISMSGITGDPTNQTNSWQPVCGGTSSAATLAAITAAQQNLVGGTTIPASGIKVYYSGGSNSPGTVADCSTLSSPTLSTPPESLTTAFAINPIATVAVTQPSLPTFFSRIWGRTGSSVSATASAEAFNPSGSENFSASANVVPVQPRCVKPWIVPNADPLNPGKTFVNTTDGSITTPGVQFGSSTTGVIGETFTLVSDCGNTPGSCNPPSPDNPPKSNSSPSTPPPTLDYVPATVSGTPAAVPNCATADTYQEAIAGCDETTAYQCGVQASSATNPTTVDFTENPGRHPRDTLRGTECLIHQGTGQDQIQNSSLPFPIIAEGGNPLKISGSQITSSSSIVSLPIYDSGGGAPFSPANNQVTIVGFLQVFINQAYANPDGNVSVTVLNVAGCGNGASGNVASTAITGTSPVPVRLITPP